jgi:hypothetical protein
MHRWCVFPYDISLEVYFDPFFQICLSLYSWRSIMASEFKWKAYYHLLIITCIFLELYNSCTFLQSFVAFCCVWAVSFKSKYNQVITSGNCSPSSGPYCRLRMWCYDPSTISYGVSYIVTITIIITIVGVIIIGKFFITIVDAIISLFESRLYGRQ